MYKELFSIVATALTFIAFLPYIFSIFKGETKPHVFSWIIWGSTTFIVFLAQLSDGGGLGAWPIGISGIITLYVAWLAYTKKADSTITIIDWGFLLLALLTLPLWAVTSDALWTVLILTAVDIMGFGPTFRKAYHHPFEEQLVFYNLIATRNFVAILALEHYSLTTVFFPAALGMATVIFILMVMYRRHRQKMP